MDGFKYLFLCLDRHNGKGLKVDFYDMEWTPMPFEALSKEVDVFILKPKCFDEMVEVTKKTVKKAYHLSE